MDMHCAIEVLCIITHRYYDVYVQLGWGVGVGLGGGGFVEETAR